MASRTCHQYESSGTCSYGPRCRYAHVAAKGKSKKATTGSRKSRKGKRNSGRPRATNYLKEFFAGYAGFDYDPTKGATNEFHRLCNEFGWRPHSEDRDEARAEFKDALVKQFNNIYGTDENSLESWQGLCGVLGIPISENLDECRKAVRAAHVNLVDLVDMPNSDCVVTLFESEVALSEYTKKSEKFDPKENAYAGGLLRFLLRQIMDPKLHMDQRKR